MRQRTIRRPVSARGPGLHTGAPAVVTCRPAGVHTGIVFSHMDRPGSPPLRASLDAVTGTQRGVTLGAGEGAVRTVEHLLAAAAGLGITNLAVEVDGPELPILDGSAAPYCVLLEGAGIEEQDATLEPLAPQAPAWAGAGGASALALPHPGLRVTYVVPLYHRTLGPAQAVDLALDPAAFVREVAPARTWGFAAELEKLRARGLAAGASLETALGIGPEGYLNPPRMPDEPARHKVLDLMGDLALLGRPLRAHIIAVGAGHAVHIALARTLQDAGRGARPGRM